MGKHQVMPTNTGFTLTNVSDGRCLRIVNRQMIYSCRMPFVSFWSAFRHGPPLASGRNACWLAHRSLCRPVGDVLEVARISPMASPRAVEKLADGVPAGPLGRGHLAGTSRHLRGHCPGHATSRVPMHLIMVPWTVQSVQTEHAARPSALDPRLRPLMLLDRLVSGDLRRVGLLDGEGNLSDQMKWPDGYV